VRLKTRTALEQMSVKMSIVRGSCHWVAGHCAESRNLPMVYSHLLLHRQRDSVRLKTSHGFLHWEVDHFGFPACCSMAHFQHQRSVLERTSVRLSACFQTGVHELQKHFPTNWILHVAGLATMIVHQKTAGHGPLHSGGHCGCSDRSDHCSQVNSSRQTVAVERMVSHNPDGLEVHWNRPSKVFPEVLAGVSISIREHSPDAMPPLRFLPEARRVWLPDVLAGFQTTPVPEAELSL